MPELFFIPLHAADGTVRAHALVDAEGAAAAAAEARARLMTHATA